MISPVRITIRQTIEKAVKSLPPDADIGTVRAAIDRSCPYDCSSSWYLKMWYCEGGIYLRARFPARPKPTPIFDPHDTRAIPHAGRPKPRLSA
jgi:hypothetical protein